MIIISVLLLVIWFALCSRSGTGRKVLLVLLLLGYLLLTAIVGVGSLTTGGGWTAAPLILTLLLAAEAAAIFVVAVSRTNRVPAFVVWVLLLPGLLVIGSSLQAIFI